MAARAGDRRVITFDDFSGGEFGTLGNWNAPKDSFTGLNVVRYVDGSIGPRCGLKDLAPASVPTGALLGFGVTHVGGKELWFVKGNTVYGIPGTTGGTAVAYTTTLAITPTVPVANVAAAGGISYMTVFGDKGYSANHDTRAMTAMADVPGGKCITIYGERLIVANASGATNRLYYSEAGVFTNFTNTAVTNPPGYIDVGSSWTITGLYPLRQNLAIAKQDGSWWILSGVPGVNEVVRQVTRTGAPINPSDATLTNDGLIWGLPQNKDVPAAFNGSAVREIEHLGFTNGYYSSTALPPAFGVVSGRWPGDVGFFSGQTSPSSTADRFAQYRQKVWTFHTFDVTTSGFATSAPGSRNSWYYYVTDGGASGVAAKFYALSASSNQPPLTTETNESVGDASDTPFDAHFTLPEWHAKDGEEVAVRSVIVDFEKYSHGGTADNSFTVTVTPRRLFDDGDGSTVDSVVWSEDEAEGSFVGVRDRVQQNMAAVFSSGFVLAVTNLVGVAIHRIVVLVDSRPMQGVA